VAQDIEQPIRYKSAVAGSEIVARTKEILNDSVSGPTAATNEVEQLHNMTDEGSSSQ
jgi:hypothetical protein